MWENRWEVYEELKTSLKDYGQTLAGYQGALEAEYQYGRLIFEVGINFVSFGSVSGVSGFGKLNATMNVLNKGKWLKRLDKIIEIGKSCKSCATIFKQSGNLRDNILKHNLDDVKLLLDKEWKSSGKHWDDFIKDYDAHHVIPVDLLDKSDALKFYYNNGGKLNFNSIENGIFVKKVAKGGEHACHPKYNDYIAFRLQEINDRILLADKPLNIMIKEFDNDLKALIKETAQEIKIKSINQKLKVNEIFIKR